MGFQIFLTRSIVLCTHLITLYWNFEYYASKRKSKNVVMCIVLILISSRKLLKFLSTEIITCFKIFTAKFPHV